MKDKIQEILDREFFDEGIKSYPNYRVADKNRDNYLVFYLTSTINGNFSDNSPLTETFYATINCYSSSQKKLYEIIKRTKRAMRNNGFSLVNGPADLTSEVESELHGAKVEFLIDEIL